MIEAPAVVGRFEIKPPSKKFRGPCRSSIGAGARDRRISVPLVSGHSASNKVNIGREVEIKTR